MKIKHLFFLALATVLMAAPAVAQDNVKKAKTILNKLSKTYKGHKNVKAVFAIVTENPDKTKNTQKGTIWVKGKSFRIDMTDQEIVCDATTIWTWQKEVKEVTVKKYKPSAKEIQPSEIFTLWEKGFDYLWVETVTEGGVSLDVIDLVPSQGKETKDYSKVKLKVDAAKQRIVSCTIIKKNGVKMTYSITSQEKNLSLAKDFFKMDVEAKKKEGNEVVNLN